MRVADDRVKNRLFCLFKENHHFSTSKTYTGHRSTEPLNLAILRLKIGKKTHFFRT